MRSMSVRAWDTVCQINGFSGSQQGPSEPRGHEADTLQIHCSVSRSDRSPDRACVLDVWQRGMRSREVAQAERPAMSVRRSCANPRAASQMCSRQEAGVERAGGTWGRGTGRAINISKCGLTESEVKGEFWRGGNSPAEARVRRTVSVLSRK
jgi:hypothetical protein